MKIEFGYLKSNHNMHTYILKVIKTEDKMKPYQLIKEGKIIAEGKATSANLFSLFIDRYNPRIDFVNDFKDRGI